MNTPSSLRHYGSAGWKSAVFNLCVQKALQQETDPIAEIQSGHDQFFVANLF